MFRWQKVVPFVKSILFTHNSDQQEQKESLDRFHPLHITLQVAFQTTIYIYRRSNVW